MKTLKTSLIALLMLISGTVLAESKPMPAFYRNSTINNLASASETICHCKAEMAMNRKVAKVFDTTGALLVRTANIGGMNWNKSVKVLDGENALVLPQIVWGSPEDIDAASEELLKAETVALPAMDWGSPEDIDAASADLLKAETTALPAMNWGSPEDVDAASADLLKTAIALPAMNFGNPEDVDAASAELLKANASALPAMNWGSPEDVDAASAELLKADASALPAISWASPEEVDAVSNELLKDIQ